MNFRRGIIASSGGDSATLPAGFTAYYRGGTLVDSLGNKGDLVNNGGTLTSGVGGKTNGAYQFSANNMTIPQLFTSLTSFTIVIWFKADTTTGSSQKVLGYSDDDIFAPVIVRNGSVTNKISVYTGNGTNFWVSSSTDNTITDWNCVLFEATESGTQSLYVNNVFKETTTIGTFAEVVTVGRKLASSRSNSEYFYGAIADFGFAVDKIFTSEERTQIYQYGQT